MEDAPIAQLVEPAMRRDQALELLSQNLASLREELGISQSELARRVGKLPGYICDLERGRRSTRGPTYLTLVDIADALGVTLSTLVSTALKRQQK